MAHLDGFTRQYITTALWSTLDESDTPLDASYSIDDIAPETLDMMIADADEFQERFADLLTASGLDDERAGSYFWLSREGHGTGFFDEDLDELQAAAKSYGGFDLYVGDDGTIYGPPPDWYRNRRRGPDTRMRAAADPRARFARPPRQSRAKPRSRAPKRDFHIGQDVEMISNPAYLGHVVGFDPDGSVMVQWSGGRVVSGVSPNNLKGIARGYAGSRAGLRSYEDEPPVGYFSRVEHELERERRKHGLAHETPRYKIKSKRHP